MASRERNSNMELLRIIAMFMIIAFHIYYHCVYTQLTDADSIARLNNGWFCSPKFFPKLLILAAFSPLGKVGNSVFLLISGYFMAAKSNGVHMVKTVEKLLSQQIFAVVFLIIASFLFYKFRSDLYISLIDFNYFNRDMSWFVGYYFLIVLTADLFLNRYLESLTEAAYTKFVLILFALIQFEWAAGVLKDLSSGLKTLAAGIFLFTLGGYIRRFNPFRKIRAFSLLLLIAVCYGFVFLSAYSVTTNQIENYMRDESTATFYQSLPKYADNYLLPIVIGICIFELFRRIRMRPHRVINFLGGSTFMIYLVHDNKFFYSLWGTQDWITLLYFRSGTCILRYFGWTLATFLIGLYVYALYLLFKQIMKIWLG